MKYRPKRLRRLDRVWLDHGQPTYFITICAANRRQSIANNTVHTRLRQFLINSATHHDWWASRYILMPDHLHLLAQGGHDAVPLGNWIKALKAVVAEGDFKWQASFFDHALPSDESLAEKWDYIRNNPVRAGLVADPVDWPFGGEIIWDEIASGAAPGEGTRPTSLTTAGGVNEPGQPPNKCTIATKDQTQSRDVGRVPSPGAAHDVPVPSRKNSAASVVEIVRYGTRTGAHPQPDAIVAEEPLEIRIEGRSVAVVMRTPGHDRELAAGFLLTENLVRAATDIFDITQCGQTAEENVLNVTLRNPASFDPAKLSRNVFTSSSCGVCSKATIAAVRQYFSPIVDDCRVSAVTVLTLPAALRSRQETFERTGGLHACALFDLQGHLHAIREDVGRHNALDKLIGNALLENRLPLCEQVLLLSGRVSFEMMQKALAAGIPIVAAISAPTTLAVEFARESNQTLIGFIRGQTMNIYAGAERISATDSHG